ncbi:MAG: hypothetical protein HYW47_02770 [Deltaproteobacteria bacterium]|nr:hypothetical protein [Deltaproteobacteria bacterium]
MKKIVLVLTALFITQCTTVEKISQESDESKKNQSLIITSHDKPTEDKRSPAWVTQNIIFEENSLGVSSKIEFEGSQSPIEGLMLSDAAAKKQFKTELHDKLFLFLNEQKEKFGLQEDKLKHIISSILESEATEKELYIDQRFYKKEDSKLICYSLAKISLKNMGSRFQKTLKERILDPRLRGDDGEIENLWEGFLSGLNSSL